MAGNYSVLANCLVAQRPHWDFIATTVQGAIDNIQFKVFRQSVIRMGVP